MVYENKALLGVTLNQVLTNSNDAGLLGIVNTGDLKTGTGNLEVGDAITSGNPTFKINGWDGAKKIASLQVTAGGDLEIKSPAADNMILAAMATLTIRPASSVTWQDPDDSNATRLSWLSATGKLRIGSKGDVGLVFTNEDSGADPSFRSNSVGQILDLAGKLEASGDLLSLENLVWKDGTGFVGTLKHANSANRDYTFPNVAGEVLLGGADQTVTFTNKSLKMQWNQDIGSGFDGGLELEAIGVFAGDLLHIHQHTGNPGAVDLVHLEATDADVITLRVKGPNPFRIEDASGDALIFAQPVLSGDRIITWQDVAGQVAIWNGVNAATTRLWSVDAHGIVHAISAAAAHTWTYDGGNLWAESTTVGESLLAVHLPDGAVVTALRVTSQYTAAARMQIELIRGQHSDGTLDILAHVDTTASMEEVADTSIDTATIDNDTYGYYLSIGHITNAAEVRLRAIQIDYTVTAPQP